MLDFPRGEDQFHAAISHDALQVAWARIKRRGGHAAGGDGETVSDFAPHADGRIKRLAAELAEDRYIPGSLRPVTIRKDSGGTRTLQIPCVIDRIAQRAAASVLSAILEPHFEDSSYAYRPGRSVQQAVDRVAYLRRQGYTYVVDADIRAYFDSVPHALLLKKLAAHDVTPLLCRLVKTWLESFSATDFGLAQGSPISPVLANLYLDALDEQFGEKSAVRIVRFADDFVLLARSRLASRRALDKAAEVLAHHGLELHPDKTRLVAFEDAFTFLGKMFVRSIVIDKEEEAPTRLEIISDDVPPVQQPTMPREIEPDRDADDLAQDRAPLYLLEPGRKLIANGEGFVVDQNGKDLLRVPAILVSRIDLGIAVEADDGALRLAADNRIPVTFLNAAHLPQSVLLPAIRSDAGLHLAQARAAMDPVQSAQLAGAMVGARVRGMQGLLKRLNHKRQLEDILAAGKSFRRGWRKAEISGDIDVARNVEKEMAQKYWPLLAQCLEHGFTLPSRRPEAAAKKPFNHILDFTAHLLTRDVTSAVLRARLHPGFGVLHVSGDRRDACVYDLIEAFRAPLAESVSVQLVNNRIIGLDDFTDGSRMSREAARRLVETYERRINVAIKNPHTGKRSTWRALLLSEARAFARAVEAGAPFKPYGHDY